MSRELYPKEIASYNDSKHIWKFKNGSIIDFGYCQQEADVYQYQSAEYDTIRFDELTHFTEYMYLYLFSRLRGANTFPKQIKSSTNPGGVGHVWVKERFIDPAPPLTEIKSSEGTRIFIPAKVQENKFLMESDPGYIRTLDNLPENERKALRDGEWNLFEGRFFTEWDPAIHIMKPFAIPKEWRRVFVMDYGLDMLAGYWIALDYVGNAYVYREVYQSNLIISSAAALIKELTGTDKLEDMCAPPDLWNRRQETGRSVADIFAENGIYLRKVNNGREQGWLDLREWLKVVPDETGAQSARLRIFENCRNIIRYLPAVQYDPKNPNDIANDPHELTHGPDALRYFAASRPIKPRQEAEHYTISDEIAELFEFEG